MTFTNTVSDVQKGFEAAAVVVLTAGVIGGAVIAGRDLIQRRRDSYRRVRSFIGRSILLGLEIFVAADLIRTVAVDPSIQSVGVLAIIVLIRTFLSFSMDVEIEGRLPWHPGDRGMRDAEP
jgi:uncharacterized membrane protein